MAKNNIWLIGYMGTGKSSVSQALSQLMKREWVDMDELIEKKAEMSIADIFKNHGETYFRDLESQLLEDILKRNHRIISCGGGIVLRDENIQLMKSGGVIVRLLASAETIYERIESTKNRPLFNRNATLEGIQGLMAQREEQYKKAADITINTEDKDIADIAGELISILKL